MAQWVKNLPSIQIQETQEMWVPSLSWKIPWRRKWQPTPVFFIGKSHERGAWWAIVQRITKSWTWLTTWTHTDTVSSFIWVVGRVQYFAVVGSKPYFLTGCKLRAILTQRVLCSLPCACFFSKVSTSFSHSYFLTPSFLLPLTFLKSWEIRFGTPRSYRIIFFFFNLKVLSVIIDKVPFPCKVT